MLIDRSGLQSILESAPLKTWLFPRFSPDGQRIAAEIHDAGGHIWVYDLTSTTLMRLTSEGHNTRPAWSPDGSRVAYWRLGAEEGADGEIYSRPADASEPEVLVPGSVGRASTMDWFPSGDRMAVVVERDIWSMPVEGDTTLTPIIATPADESAGVVSRDGRWIAYVSNESGTGQVYVRAADGTGPRYTVSVGSVAAPFWAFRGTELFYAGPAGFVSAKLEFEPSYRVTREVLFNVPEVGPLAGDPSYAVHPDGEHFLFVRTVAQADLRLRVIVNFGEQLRRWIAAASGGD